jgi:hypothetical protein
VEEINRQTLLDFKTSLCAEECVNDTRLSWLVSEGISTHAEGGAVLNKLMIVTTWLKRNTVVRITGWLLGEDWPTKKKTNSWDPNPRRMRGIYGKSPERGKRYNPAEYIGCETQLCRATQPDRVHAADECL